MIFGPSRKRRRAQLRAERSPAAWPVIAARNVSIFRRLSFEDQDELLGHVRVLLDEKHFEGAGGLELTDEMRITIAAQACLLLLHRETDYFPRLQSIIVYPSGYITRGERHVGDGIWDDSDEDMLGHTQENLGALVLAWDSVRHGALMPVDGENLVLHEFAHQLDFEDATTDGTPLLESRAEYRAWKDVMREEFETLRAADDDGRMTLIDPYGATDPAEFFAVVTETFFERPRALRRKHPRLYELFSAFYRQNPAAFVPDEPSIP
jgi:MtfA peptidase